MAVSGFSVAYLAIGGVLLFSGFKGATPSAVISAALNGNLSSVTSTMPITAPTVTESTSQTGTTDTSGSTTGDTGASSAGASSNQALAKSIATSMGLTSWTTGTTWDDWVSLWNQESGWSNTADNATSGAYGIAQALGHGTDGAPYPSEYESANPPAYGGTSNATAQIEWGISYIQSTYGSPVMAWAHEQANDWY